MSRRTDNTRAILFGAVMVISMVAIGFAGGASADVTGITANSAEDVAVGQQSVTQDVTFETTIDGASDTETVTIDVSNVLSDDEVDITDTSDVNLDSGDTGEVSVNGVTDNAGGDGENDGTIDITLKDDTGDTSHTVTATATLTLNTAGVGTNTGISYTVQDNNDDSDTTSFDLVKPSEITVTDTNDNGIQYAVDTVQQDGKVSVEAGTYNGDVKIQTEGITLEGPKSGTPGGADSRGPGEAKINGVVTVGQNGEFGNVVIDGFTVEAAPDDTREFADQGVFMISEKGNLIGNNVIENNIIIVDDSNSDNDGTVAGVYYEGNSNLELSFENNLFKEAGSDTGDTNQAIRQTNSPISSVNITDNIIDTEGSIWLTADGDVTAEISGNTFKSTIGSTYAAVYVEDESGGGAAVDADVIDNTFNAGIGSGVKIDDTIDVDGSDSIAILRNDFKETSVYGVEVESGVTGTINATNNWWGDKSGPSDAGPGTGAKAIAGGSVEYTPWSIASGVSTRDVEVVSAGNTVKAYADEIQTAIDNSDGPSNVVAVRATPGVYDQTVDLNKALVLNSTDPANTEIKNTGIILDITNDAAVVDGLIINKTGAGEAIKFAGTGEINNTQVLNNSDQTSQGVTVSSGSPTIENSSITNFNVGIDTQGNGATIHGNNIVDNHDYGVKSSGGSVDAKFNYWGQAPSSENGLHGPNAVSDNNVSSGVPYDPFLTKDVKSLDVQDPAKTTAFANDLTIPEDTTVAVGVPGQVPDDFVISDLTDPNPDEIQYYNKNDEKWETVQSADYDVSSLESFKITTGSDSAVINVEYADSTGVGSVTLEQGWNFVPSPKNDQADADAGLDLRNTGETTEELYNPYTTANNQIGTDSGNVGPAVAPTWQVTPFKGYWVFINDGSKSISTKAPGGTQADEVRTKLGI